MAKSGNAWYDRKWVSVISTALVLVSGLFREEIRAVVTSPGLLQRDWLYDLLMAGGVIGLVVVLVLKSDRAARTCEDLRGQLQEDLAKHRRHLNKDLANHRKQLHEELVALVDSKLKSIVDRVGTMHSNLSAFGSRLDALDSRISALKETLASSSDST